MITKVGLYKDKRNKSRPWVVRWFGEYDPEKEKQKHYSKAFATKREAEAFRTITQAELDCGGTRDLPQDVPLSEYVDRFMQTKGKTRRLETRKTYQNTFDQLQKFFGPNIPIRQITPEQADQFIASRDRIASYGSGYSSASRARHLRNCKAAFRLAIQWGYLKNNPFDHIRPGKVSAQRWHHLKPTEFAAILSVVTDSRWRAFYFLAYTTGARLGELFNLTWSDVDFEKNVIMIRDRKATPETPPFHVKDHEARAIPLPSQTVSALLAWQMEASEGVPYILLTADRWKRVQAKWRLCHAGTPWKYNGKTDALEWGEWENRCMVNNVVRDMRAHVRKAGLDLSVPLTVHMLRKSFAQNHADAGTSSVTLKALMGHCSITTTEKYYLQNSDANTQAALHRYENLIGSKNCVRIAYEAPTAHPDVRKPTQTTSISQAPAKR